jgi:hypothetical protein
MYHYLEAFNLKVISFSGTNWTNYGWEVNARPGLFLYLLLPHAEFELSEQHALGRCFCRRETEDGFFRVAGRNQQRPHEQTFGH